MPTQKWLADANVDNTKVRGVTPCTRKTETSRGVQGHARKVDNAQDGVDGGGVITRAVTENFQ
eukprot:1505957-Pleurochrysis_carterae.AAC.1